MQEEEEVEEEDEDEDEDELEREQKEEEPEREYERCGLFRWMDSPSGWEEGLLTFARAQMMPHLFVSVTNIVY